MNQYKTLISGFLMLIWVLTPLISISQIPVKNPKANSYTLEVIEESPSNFEVNNGTVLYSGAINDYTQAGKAFRNEHSQISETTIQDINDLGFNLSRTRQLNRQYLDLIAKQVNTWKTYSDKNPSYSNYLSRELQIFNIGTDLQLQENTKWAVIESTLKEIESLNNQKAGPASMSFAKSSLYTDLMLYYLDLIEFYKGKYKEIITLSTLSHATQENPNLKLPDDILGAIKPLHEEELNLAKVLIYDLKDNINKLKTISDKASELNAFYNKVDRYSLQEINNIIDTLERTEAKSQRANQTNFLAQNQMDPLVDSYIDYYKELRTQLEDKIISYEIREAALIAMYDEQLTELTYTGMLHPGMEYAGFSDWASSAWEGVKKGTKIVSGAAFAAADYATGKVSETIFEVTDKAEAMYNHGIFTDEYNQWSEAYDKAGDKLNVVNIKDTFVDPLIATLQGDDKHGLGQAAVNKAQGSFQQFDKYVADKTGSNFVSQVALNTVTCGGYGLAKDFTTINDANASTTDKIVAGAGIALALAPALSGAKAANEGSKGAVKSATTSYNTAKNNILNAVNNSNAASNTLKNASQNLANATDDLIKAAGPNFKNADVLNSTFNSVANNFDNAVINKVTSQIIFNNVKNQVNTSVKNGLINVPKDTLTGTIKSTVSGFLSDHSLTAIGNRFNDLYKNSLTTAIKNAEPFFGATVGQAIGIKDLANFTLTNFINNNVSGGITTLLKDTLEDKNKTPTATQNQQSSSTVPMTPVNQQPGQSVVPLVPDNLSNNQSYLPPTGTYYPPQNIQGSLPPQMPYGGYPPQATNPTLLQQYLSSQQQGGNKPNINPEDFNTIGTMISQNQQQFDDNRGTTNYNPNPDPNLSSTFSTNLTGQSGTSMTQHIQQLSQQTSNMNPHPPSQPQNPTQPQNPPSNIPIGDGVPENNRTNGIDDDNDGVIDEGPASGNCQIAIHDTGGDKDDQWELSVDGSNIGRNNQGKTRFWDLNLSRGQHSVSATGVDIPDNTGTYTIWFGTCSKTSGPPLTGQNLNQGTTFTWIINVP